MSIQKPSIAWQIALANVTRYAAEIASRGGSGEFGPFEVGIEYPPTINRAGAVLATQVFGSIRQIAEKGDIPLRLDGDKMCWDGPVS